MLPILGGKAKVDIKGKCFHSNVEGHWKRNCPKYLVKKKEKEGATYHVCSSLHETNSFKQIEEGEMTLKVGTGGVISARAMGDMRYPCQNTTVKRRLQYPPSNDDFSPLFYDTLLLTTTVQPMKTLSSLSIVVVSVHPSLCSSSLSSHDFPRISYFSASISQTCNLLASSNLSPSSTWVLLRVLCLPARLSTAIRHLKLMIRG
ncbi:gag/pol protein [Cucumis melo var. makuwa]|uniref:Gag/pol protein n=1 Tax=Cucumis melo var. makuwa TaxID=1194695 RepID=A0A5A7TQ62_CUCMM|nr:gag/pol protein [Cucumis melo var. makuwa]